MSMLNLVLWGLEKDKAVTHNCSPFSDLINFNTKFRTESLSISDINIFFKSNFLMLNTEVTM